MATQKPTFNAKMFLPLLSLPISLLSAFVVFPLAAWNHNLFLVILAILVPLAMAQLMHIRAGRKLFTGFFTKKTAILYFVYTVMAFLLWNHLWFLAILLVIAELVINSRAMKKK